MLGSLTFYRRILNERVFNKSAFQSARDASADSSDIVGVSTPKLPAVGHGIAGFFAGSTGTGPPSIL